MTARDKVIVFHPERQHSHLTAHALQRADLLELYLTGFYFKDRGALATLLDLLPRSPRAALERRLARRRYGKLDDRLVLSRPLYILAERLIAHSALGRALWPGFRRDALAWMEAWAGGWVARRRPKALIAYDGAALGALARARAAGAVAILDQTIGHVKLGREIMREERARYPAWKDSFDAIDPDWMVEKCVEEVHGADRILAPSDYVISTLVEVGARPERIVKLPYGVDVERFAPAPRTPRAGFRILLVGILTQRKGIMYLLEAVRRLSLPGIEVVLVGNLYLDRATLAPYADVATHVPHVADIERFYRESDIFVLPSLHEGSAQVTYEAMASGVPVITTPNAGSPARDGIDGFVVPARDTEALMDRIERLYRDAALRAQMGVNARARIMEFTSLAYSERLVAFIRGLGAGA
ncbi:MAG TPA: glycosyltransferase family 4 protein [Alphaproteobacteria bacterium]|nr:glycosyltransferase family 4 protein [Alphaproteobacteria bacterium]